MTKLEKVITNSRILYALKQYGYNYIEDLLDLSQTEIHKIPRIGKKSAEELISFLNDYSLSNPLQAKQTTIDFTEAERNFLISAVLDKTATDLRSKQIKEECLNKLKNK